MQQWLLARPEFREFLPTRIMVAYPEPWMDRVDAMKRLQGWTDTSVLHFRNLADLRRADAAFDPLRPLERESNPIQAPNWARVLAARDPGLHPRLPRGNRRRPVGRSDRRYPRGFHLAIGTVAEAAGEPTAGELRWMRHTRLHLGALSRDPSPEPIVETMEPAHPRPSGGAIRAAGRLGGGANAVGAAGLRAGGIDAHRRCICFGTFLGCWASSR